MKFFDNVFRILLRDDFTANYVFLIEAIGMEFQKEGM